MGLWRVVSRSNEPAVAQTAVSLTLGGPGPLAAAPTSSPTTAPTASPTSTPSAAAAPAPRPVPVTSPVAIFNASNTRGLATRTAALLRARGVAVAAVANLSGTRKPFEGTVFYAPGLEAQARTLAGLIGAPAVAPAPDWIPADGRLVLVVTGPSTTSASAPLPTS